MASASVVSRTKSTNWLRSKWSQNTEMATAKAEVNVGEGDTLAFEKILPATCNKYGCSVPIFVKKEFIRDGYPKMKRKSSTKEEADKIKTASSRRSTGKKVIPEKETPVEIAPAPNAVIITARYDKCNRLTELVMNKTNLRNIEIMQVVALLAPYCSVLNKIVIQRCRVNASVIQNLSKMLPLTTITEICLDESPLPEANYAILLNTEGNILKHLSLARCLINDVICEQIASKLHYNMVSGKQLMTLNLSSNHITNEGAKSLADALRTNRRLRYLNLANNRIGDTGFSHILDTLAEFPLTYNEMMQKKGCYFQYLKKRLAFSMEQLRFVGLNSHSDSTSSPRSSKKIGSIVSAKSGAKLARKNSAVLSLTEKVQMKKVKTQNESINPENEEVNRMKSGIINYKQNESVNPEILDSFLTCIGPFHSDNLVEKDGWAYSKGNMELSYLNIAYNDLTYVCMRKLSNVLIYQSEVRKPGETGLIQINVEGNPLPVDCPETEAIYNILAKMFTTKRSSKAKSFTFT